jgi:hypothetical protein
MRLDVHEMMPCGDIGKAVWIVPRTLEFLPCDGGTARANHPRCGMLSK